MNKVTILYHNDADGFGAAYALWRKYNSRANYIPVMSHHAVPEIPEGTEKLYIVDFSYSLAICESLAERYALQIYDHHITAQKELESMYQAHVDITKAASRIVWEEIHGSYIPPILQYVEDYDLWRHALPESNAVNLYIHSLPKQFEAWDREIGSSFFARASTAGAHMKLFQDNQINRAMKDVRIMVLNGAHVPVVNVSENISEVGHALCKGYPVAPYSASYCDRKDVRSWSLRSIGAFDVSEVAKQFGGGGHKNSAGFSTEIGWPQISPPGFDREFEALTGNENVTWTCCGGVILDQDEKCPVCGDRYD